MARKPGKSPQAIRDRAARTANAMATSSAVATAPGKTGPGFFQSLANAPRFFREVRAEARKITWTSRQETWITSVMVGIMVVLATVFFTVVNQLCSLAITAIVKLANGG